MVVCLIFVFVTMAILSQCNILLSKNEASDNKKLNNKWKVMLKLIEMRNVTGLLIIFTCFQQTEVNTT